MSTLSHTQSQVIPNMFSLSKSKVNMGLTMFTLLYFTFSLRMWIPHIGDSSVSLGLDPKPQ